MLFPLDAVKPSDGFEMGDRPCFITYHKSSCFLPIGDLLPESEHGLIEVVVIDEGQGLPETERLASLQPASIDQLRGWLDEAYSQYRAVLLPEETFMDRCDDWLVDDLGVTAWEALAIFEKRGITPFLRLERVVFVPSMETVCFDLKCFADAYLWDHGFNVDKAPNGIWNTSPRGLFASDRQYPATHCHRREPPAE